MTTQVNNIIDIFQNFRMNPLPTDEFESKGKLILSNKMNNFVQNQQPIKFSIMGELLFYKRFHHYSCH